MLKHGLVFLFLFCCMFQGTAAQPAVCLPDESGSKPALEIPYFPGQQYAFVWRNWTLVPDKKLAETLNTSVGNVRRLARSLGLPPQGSIDPRWSSSAGYITVLRRNWHLLPYEQLLTLLGVSREELAWRLKEDDYLYIKLGSLKPLCAPLHYQEPTRQQEQAAQHIARQVKSWNKNTFAREKPRFAFIDQFAKVTPRKKSNPSSDSSKSTFELRMIYPYCATFGDPLTDPDLTSYPEGLLQKLSEAGVNGIWMHSVLRSMVEPEGIFPGDANAPKRIDGLNRLVQRAQKYGIGIYLYINEPRSMERSFFESDSRRQALGGVLEGDNQALCSSVPDVLDWTSRSLEKVFRQVPGLAGVFTITGSENLTFCASHHGQQQCERCKNRPYADLVAEVNRAIAQGVTRGNPQAKVIVWDWGWDDRFAHDIIQQLPKCCWLMSVSEWAIPITRGGIPSAVGEYALSVVGPGPRATPHWQYAKQAGLKTIAKVQVNSSWELSVVPDIPVLDLVARHAENLSAAATDGVMLSWSLGGYPSQNLELFQSYRPGDPAQNLTRLAEKHYGRQAAPTVCKAWSLFSSAFEEFPYNGVVLYNGPQHMGPANPLYVQPTGYVSSMVGIPYDALDHWRWNFPPEVFAAQMQHVADGFDAGCNVLRQALSMCRGEHLHHLKTMLGRAQAVALHFASSASQIRFTHARNQYLNATDPVQKRQMLALMHTEALAEANHAQQLMPLIQQDPTIGYESSNHYFYVPQDLREKELNVQYVLNWIRQQEQQLQ